ncbi:SDR family oxidoreductase [Xanthomonas hyacinthi]|uniref:Short-chain dehydrogenase n=1 Tax=Xanthomonas hyacinthi TaxID=56455 RepID=A0A2S7EUP7_9XANT|nr:SDR family oxidoreductase [Xanthomonas hyacinthi]KLD76915.1 short-chain dehydrogenase [Xanthomonas hyacinthi DSM 19077]PPU96850.1 short-chain dehydrogenase [Xanthomonas hyacinthi]QGY76189.1 SDR family oxidoreductase [Xanthomonas hyacinthi]
MSLEHIVIVGGSSGIGFATARQLLALGHKVTITGRNEQQLAVAKDRLSGDLAALVLDAADTARLPGAFARIGAFDHLVLALGSGKGAGPFASVSLAEVRQGFEEKVFPHFATAQAALPTLRKDGSITFISAVTAQAAMPGTAGIGAANAAVAALVPILAAELRPLRVNGVSPGVIDTPWWDFLTDEQKTSLFADYAAKTPAGRVGQPQDVAQAITFLIANSFIDGHVITCDGGLRLCG